WEETLVTADRVRRLTTGSRLRWRGYRAVRSRLRRYRRPTATAGCSSEPIAGVRYSSAPTGAVRYSSAPTGAVRCSSAARELPAARSGCSRDGTTRRRRYTGGRRYRSAVRPGIAAAAAPGCDPDSHAGPAHSLAGAPAGAG